MISFNTPFAPTINLNLRKGKGDTVFLSSADVYFLQHYTKFEYIFNNNSSVMFEHLAYQ